MSSMNSNSPTRWDLNSIYPGLDSPQLQRAFTTLRAQIAGLEMLLRSAPEAAASAPDLASAVSDLIERFNALLTLSWTVRSYLNMYVTTDSYNDDAARMMSEYE